MIGETVAHYRILAEIGEGGMGVVYLAEDTRLHCRRALKFLPATLTPDSPNHVRLVNEARALAALEHPNICPVQEIGEHKGQTFIVMSYLEGRTLKDRLEEGPIPLDEALEISRQISAGLAAAHAKGIVHRDVKPDNVMLTEHSGETGRWLRATLMDFGIAKKRDTTLVTRTGTVMGTAAYMSPEQAQGLKVGAATDVWAVGIILYEMLAGQRPFSGELEPALLYAIVNTHPEPLTGRGRDIPDAVDRVIGKALEKDPANRHVDAGALLVDLDRAAAGEAIKGRGLARRRYGPKVGTAIGLLAILIVGLFVWPGLLVPSDTISVLAVMPLEDRSSDPVKAYFAEGVADELATGLQKIGALTIVSRRSATRARTIYESNQEIGKKLGVDALIEGSVQRNGDRVKVTVQLVATEDDRVLWSDSFTREMRDVLNLQSEVALSIATALEIQLTSREQQSLVRDRPIDPEAYEEFLLGRHFLAEVTAERCERAITHFEKALTIQPDFALAHIKLADAHGLHQQMAHLPATAKAETVKYHARKAIEIDPELGASHMAMGNAALLYDMDLSSAGMHFTHAREIDPNLSMILYAQYLNVIGRHQDALREARIAARQEPLDPFIQANLAWRQLFAGDLEETQNVLDKLEEWKPGYWIAQWVQGVILIMQGNPGQAIAHLQLAVTNSGGGHDPKGHLIDALLLDDRREEALSLVANLEAEMVTHSVPPFVLGWVYAAVGRTDDAFATLELAFLERDWRLLWSEAFTHSPLRKLKGDPRWDSLIKRIGIPPQ